jgi:hypothetical protein
VVDFATMDHHNMYRQSIKLCPSQTHTVEIQQNMYKTLTLLKMKLGSLQDLDSSDYHNTFGIGLQLIKPKKLMKQRNGKNTQIWNIAGFFFFFTRGWTR